MPESIGTDLARSFLLLFDGLSRAYGIYNVGENREPNGKRVGAAATKMGKVDEELWSRHLSGEQGLGIIPIRDDNCSVFGAIDVDVYEDISHAEIARKLERMKLPLIPCRSKSGGAHLYLFAQHPISAEKMQTKLREIAAFLGYGGSEIFPKQTKLLAEKGDIGQWINMPYFSGVRGMRVAILPDGNALDPGEFIELAHKMRQSADWFDQPILLDDEFSDGPPCLQILSKLGYPPGTRNDGLYNIGVYLKKSDPDKWKDRLDESNHAYMQPPLPMSEVQGVIKSLERKDYNYTCTKQPICFHCDATLCRTRKFGVGGGQGKFPTLGGLTKLNTKPPTWFWTVDGSRIELQTSELQDPRAFQRRCMETINQMPTIPSSQVWQATVQHALSTVTVVEAPKDASPEGQFWELVEKFCTSRAQAASKDEIILGKPWTDSGRTYFRLGDLIEYLQRHKFTDFRTTKVSAILRDAGAEHHNGNFRGRCVNFWSLKAFAAQVQEFDVPDSVNGRTPF